MMLKRHNYRNEAQEPKSNTARLGQVSEYAFTACNSH
jgi:hypothetical protein